MSNKNIKTSKLLLMGLVIFGIPSFSAGLFNYWDRKDFQEELSMNRDLCYERADRYKFPAEVCNEIISNVKDAHRASKSNVNLSILALSGIIYGLATGLIGLKAEIDELKEKIDV